MLTSDFMLQAWKAHILFRHADDSHRQRGLRETMDLCNQEPPVSDVDALDMLYQTLKRIGGHEDTVRTMWERAAKVKPQNLELQTRWFNHASEQLDWKSAQKVSYRIDQMISFIQPSLHTFSRLRLAPLAFKGKPVH